jgi:hypothetical protein
MDNVMDTSRELVRDICVFVKSRIGVTTGEVDLRVSRRSTTLLMGRHYTRSLL